MKLFIKQEVFTLRDRFYVKDESGADKYYVEGEFLSFGKRLHVYDMNGMEVVYIEQQIWNLFPTYDVYVKGILKCRVCQKLNWTKRVFEVQGLDWVIEGSFWLHDYQIVKGNSIIATISKEWFTWGDSYMMDISNHVNELDALAMILAVDCASESNNNH